MKGTGNSTLKFTNDPLWQKIDSFPIDDPASLFPFSRKLAQENNWHPAFIERAIREYKRFVYLCCTIPEGASPPPVVDEVWHLHMLYTENYWEEFCEKTLGRKLHHRPSRGGPEEKEKHVNWLQASIENYRLVFDENPPEDIWQTEDPDHPPQTSPKEGSVIQWRYVLTCVVAVLIAGYFGVAQYLLFIIVPLLVGGIIWWTSSTISDNRKEGNSKSDGSSGCGGGGNGCGSSCGGGCGGCGGS